MLNIIKKDILTVENGIIIHQVNCQKVAGKGLALKIARKYPKWKVEFKDFEPILGRVGFYVHNKNLIIANCYSQNQYGYGRTFTDYKMLRRCLELINQIPDYDKYIPYGIGCGLGGGDWKIVSRIIENAIPDAIICKFD